MPDGTFLGAEALAARIEAPPNYLAKLLQLLARKGLVESRKGLGGGFRLARPPQAIRLFDVLDPIDHVTRWEGCFLGRSVCSEEDPCAVHRQWTSVRTAFATFITGTTIADLASTAYASTTRLEQQE